MKSLNLVYFHGLPCCLVRGWELVLCFGLQQNQSLTLLLILLKLKKVLNKQLMKLYNIPFYIGALVLGLFMGLLVLSLPTLNSVADIEDSLAQRLVHFRVKIY